MLLSLAFAAALLVAQDPPVQADSNQPQEAAEQERIDADRPHVGTGAHLIEPGQLQFEWGIQRQKASDLGTFGSPVLLRIGATRNLELRVATDGFVSRDIPASTTYGVGNAQIGAKIRLIGAGDEPVLSVMPQVNLGLASADKGLGSGETDATVTLLAGHALGPRVTVEGNYGIGSIGSATGRFPQHLLTGALVHQTMRRLATYGEIAWWSRQEHDGGPVSFIDYAPIFPLTPMLLIHPRPSTP